MQNPEDVQLAAQALASSLPDKFTSAPKSPVGVILGTGLGGAVTTLGDPVAQTPFCELPAFPKAGVESHAGVFFAIMRNRLPALLQQGRCHLYEGRTPAEVCMGVRVMAALGCKTLIVSNAAGALNPLFAVPGLMLICDLINHTGVSPLTGPNNSAWGERFPDMSAPFDENLAALAFRSAMDLGIPLEKGVYIGVHGPEMETPAETRMYRQWGADAVGMSTALEVICARHLGMKCLGISCLTNRNLPDCMAPAPIEAVIAAADSLAPRLAQLIARVLSALEQAP